MSDWNDLLREVGKAQDIPPECEGEPQRYLRQSHHPYAPFSGNAVDWNSWVHDDGTTFEGTTRAQIPHGKGVFRMGAVGGGAGFSGTKPGDLYEGELHTGWAHGFGQYTSADGLIYKGEFTAAYRDGCGAVYDLKPWKDLIAAGKHPKKAWKMARKEIFDTAKYGTWRNDNFLSEPTDMGDFCSLGDIQKTLVSVDVCVNKARMFSFKPDGQATLHRMLLPDSSAPAPVMQHPLHYPHGTLFMAPGPAGQTASIPKSEELHKLMLREYRNHTIVHDQYNFDFVPASDSLMAKAQRWGAKIDKRRQQEKAIEDRRANRRLRRLLDEEGAAAGRADKAEETPVSGSTTAKQGSAADNADDGIDDDDLLADLSGVAASQPRGSAGGSFRGTAFGSVAVSMSRAHHGLGNFFERLALTAPPLPRLGVTRRR